MVKDLRDIDFQEGAVLLFNKPIEWTSFDVVNKVRWLISKKLNVKKIKVGHSGTLDPKATGLVIICTGKATRLIETIQSTEKEYVATIKLGATTPSFDLESEEDIQFETEHINLEMLNNALLNFEGEIDQVPPIFSAIKVNGKRAFDYARKGKELELEPRKVTIYEIKVNKFNLPFTELYIRCSKGTYIRSLARDIGKQLNSGAYLIGLERTGMEAYRLEDAWQIDEFIQAIETL